MQAKLVRDKIPEIIKSKGEICKFKIIKGVELINAIKEKVLEEANEIKNTKSEENLKEEIADLYEILDALIDRNHFNKQDIFKIQKEKYEKRGGFKQGIYLIKY